MLWRTKLFERVCLNIILGNIQMAIIYQYYIVNNMKIKRYWKC